MTIRSVSFPDDEALCAEAERAAFLDSSANVSDEQVQASLDRVKKQIARGSYWGYTAVENDVPVGLVLVDVEEGATFVDNLYVVPSHRRKGVGEKLMRYVLRELQAHCVDEVELMLTANNEVAVGLYEKLGFSVSRFRMRKTV